MGSFRGIPAGSDGGLDAFGYPFGTIWDPVRVDQGTAPPTRAGSEIGSLGPGDREGDIVVPAGHVGLGIRTPDGTVVHIATREQMLATLDRLRVDFGGAPETQPSTKGRTAMRSRAALWAAAFGTAGAFLATHADDSALFAPLAFVCLFGAVWNIAAALKGTGAAR